MTPQDPPPERTTGQPQLVLIVDDFEDNRAMYAEYLAYAGYRVEQASNGEEAVERTQRLKPDLVIMDMSLPVMDGWEATQRLRADERTRHIPIIALTGYAPGQGTHARDVRDAGSDAVLTKPCLPEKLVATIEDLLRPRPDESSHKTKFHGADHDEDE
jgi:two-component system cell cycle response regulator DivK